MAIEPIEYGKALRPSTVELMAKIDEVITAVNNGGGDVPESLLQDVETLKSNMATAQTDISNLQGSMTNVQNSINSIEGEVASASADITKINNSLYTPLTPDDTIDTTPSA